MIRTLAALALVLTPLPASAAFPFFHRRAEVRPAYYFVPAVYYVPAPVVPVIVYPPVVPFPVVSPPPLAVPLAAPPSLAPPLPAGPSISTSGKVSQSFYNAYPVAVTERMPPADRCSVAFWNLSGGPVVLQTGGQVYNLARGQRLTLELGREFEWRVEGREAQVSRAAAGDAGMEILIRR
jgi:hypothetical protein